MSNRMNSEEFAQYRSRLLLVLVIVWLSGAVSGIVVFALIQWLYR